VHSAVHVTALTPAPHLQAKDLDKLIATNIRAFARLVAFVDPLIAPSEKPQAVFFDDTWDEKFAGPYGMCKAAQRALVQSWQAETAKFPLRVHLLQPRPMPTAVRARFYPGEDRSALHAPRDEAARLLDVLLG
jgi:NAD(P)-dependent dehydrogenase (short-subunit alcohol dehydrogenase family)